MIATKYSLAEQVLLKLQDARPNAANTTDIRDIMAMIPQVLAGLLTTNYYNATLPTGETIPSGLNLVTYTLPVAANGMYVELPGYPIQLPRDMGVFEVADPDNPMCVFIPSLPGQMAMVLSQGMISPLLEGQMYTVNGNKVLFDKPVKQKQLQVKMFIVDIGTLDDTDIIPIPQDMQLQVIDMVFERLANLIPNNKDSDVMTDNKVLTK